MLYPNLQINIGNISKKRGPSGLEENSQLITTPDILNMAVQMSDEKNNSFAYSQPSLNQFKQERSELEKQHISLQTPILDLHQNTPFFNETPTVSSNDTNFVSPNEVIPNPFTTASSSISTSTTTNLAINSNTFNDLNQQTNHLNAILQQPNKQQDISIHQNDYNQYSIAPVYNTSNQVNQYSSGLNSNHQVQNLNDNLLINPHMVHTLSNSDQQSMTYTELKTTNQLLIPNSVYDISGGYNKKHQQPPTYQSPASPTSSLSSQTSSSNLDQDTLYAHPGSNYGESSTSHHHLNRSNRRYPSGQSSASEKKSRMTKKQKYDAMINEEKNLIKNNEKLKTDIKDLEDQISRYKQTIMNTVKSNRK